MPVFPISQYSFQNFLQMLLVKLTPVWLAGQMSTHNTSAISSVLFSFIAFFESLFAVFTHHQPG